MGDRILVYGATGGIGAATARLLRKRGFDLHLVARDAPRLAGLAQELDATFTAGDVTGSDVFLQASEEASHEGPIGGVVYAIGTINLKPLPRLTQADFLQDFRINALGAASAVQAALPALRAGAEPSSIVLFSTVAVSQGFSAHASIAMAKGAVNGLTVSLAAELAPKVRVNAIAPSLTRTPLAHSVLSSEAVASAIAQMHALPRLGLADDVASLATFLIADAPWITGQIIGVDGGRSTLRPRG